MISCAGPQRQNIGSAQVPPPSPAWSSREIGQRNYQPMGAALLSSRGVGNQGLSVRGQPLQAEEIQKNDQQLRANPSTQRMISVPSMPHFSAVPSVMLQPSPSTQQLSPSPSTQQLSTVPPLGPPTQQLSAVPAPTAQQRLEELQPLCLQPSVQLEGIVSQNQAKLGSPKLPSRGESITAQSSFSSPSAGYFQFSTGAPPPAVRSLNATALSGMEDSSGVIARERRRSGPHDESKQERERRRSGAYPTGEQNAENLRAIRENSLLNNDLRNPRRLGTAPQNEDGEKDLSDKAVRLQKKLAGITQSDRRLI